MLIKLPYYAKISILLVGLYVFISMLSIAQGIIIPIIYAAVIGISISPLVNFLIEKKVSRAVAIATVMAIIIFIIVVILGLIVSQVNLLSEAWPQMTAKFQDLLNQLIAWASDHFNVNAKIINKWLASTKSDLLDNSNAVIGSTLTTMGGVLATALLTPVYTYMMLFYQPHLVKFVHEVFGADHNEEVCEILVETKSIIQSYLAGLFVEFIIVAILNAAGLLILGIDYAILLGIIGAALNVIPYLGGIIGVVLFLIIALLTKAPIYGLYVIVLYTVIQLIDNNYIVPKIVGSKVKLNALISIVAVIAGAALWGIPGMFLSIPITAVLKLILDRIHSLKPWGFLLGDTNPPLLMIKPIFKKTKT
jgi:predicted PurR-regulated permease PerM